MKQKLKKFLIILLVIALFLGYGIYSSFYDTQRISGQEELFRSVSPDGTYTVTAYRQNGGATTSFGILCTAERGSFEEKNIYFNYPCDTAEIHWIDNDTVNINGIELNVKTDVYDFRHE